MVIAPDPVPARRPRRHKTHAAWHAHRCAAVRIRKPHPLGSEPIQIRCSYKIVTSTAEKMLAVLVGHNDEDIGRHGVCD